MTNSRIARHPGRQSGVVLIFALIVLVILTIGAVALVRSMNTSLFNAGNLAFRKDLVNQGEQAMSTVLTQLQTGALASAAVLNANAPNLNYSAVTLPANAQGIPNALLDDTAFAAVGTAANDLAGATADVAIRYVIDRLCSTAGAATAPTCVQFISTPSGGTASSTPPVTPPAITVYRVSVRVSGARNTQVFLQTTVAN